MDPKNLEGSTDQTAEKREGHSRKGLPQASDLVKLAFGYLHPTGVAGGRAGARTIGLSRWASKSTSAASRMGSRSVSSGASVEAHGGRRAAVSAHGLLPISAWAVPVSVQRRATAHPREVRRSSTISASARSLFVHVAGALSGSWYSTATLRSAGWATRTLRRRRPERTVTPQSGSPRGAEAPRAGAIHGRMAA